MPTPGSIASIPYMIRSPKFTFSAVAMATAPGCGGTMECMPRTAMAIGMAKKMMDFLDWRATAMVTGASRITAVSKKMVLPTRSPHMVMARGPRLFPMRWSIFSPSTSLPPERRMISPITQPSAISGTMWPSCFPMAGSITAKMPVLGSMSGTPMARARPTATTVMVIKGWILSFTIMKNRTMMLRTTIVMEYQIGYISLLRDKDGDGGCAARH